MFQILGPSVFPVRLSLFKIVSKITPLMDDLIVSVEEAMNTTKVEIDFHPPMKCKF